MSIKSRYARLKRAYGGGDIDDQPRERSRILNAVEIRLNAPKRHPFILYVSINQFVAQTRTDESIQHIRVKRISSPGLKTSKMSSPRMITRLTGTIAYG